ncbi:hypothetical protein [Zavarzinia sp. CC-PAN008]|uniref:hypothetical protein n=1 Tax=Zavarzinia sp. CC-PAN008 TaxID=3243332 RepID=UPI003F748387
MQGSARNPAWAIALVAGLVSFESAATPNPETGMGSNLAVAVTQPVASPQPFRTEVRAWTELVFGDGASAVLAPETAMRLDRYQAGHDLDLVLGEGSLLVTVGASDAAITAGCSMLRLASGAAAVQTGTGGTTVALLWGGPLVVGTAGDAVMLRRPGFALRQDAGCGTTTGPYRLPPADLAVLAERFRPPRDMTLGTAGGRLDVTAQVQASEGGGARPVDDFAFDRAQQVAQPVAAVDPGPPLPPASGLSFGLGTPATAEGTSLAGFVAPGTNEFTSFVNAAEDGDGDGDFNDEDVNGNGIRDFGEDDLDGDGVLDFIIPSQVVEIGRDLSIVADEVGAVRIRRLASAGLIEGEAGVLQPIEATYAFVRDEQLSREQGVLAYDLSGTLVTGSLLERMQVRSQFIGLTDAVIPNTVETGIFDDRSSTTTFSSIADFSFTGAFDGTVGTTGANRGRFVLNTAGDDFRFFVLDTTFSESVRGFVEGDRIFALGGTAVGRNLSRGLPGAPGFSVTRYAVSDGLCGPQAGCGDGFTAGGTLEDQVAAEMAKAPDQRLAVLRQGNGFRPDSTYLDGVRGDTHLLVTSSAQSGGNTAMRADLQIAADGRSSISVATGQVAPSALSQGNLVLSGGVVGSSRQQVAAGSVAIDSALGSIGTGNGPDAVDHHMFGGNTLTGARIGYFGLAQQDPTEPFGNGSAQASSLTPLGRPAVPYAFTTLATGYQTDGAAIDDLASRTAQTLQGYAAGLVELAGTGGAALYAARGASLGSIRITTDPSGNSLDVGLDLQGRTLGLDEAPAGAAGAPDRIVASLGGGEGRSAFVSDSTFAARGTQVALDGTAQDGAHLGLVSATVELMAGIEVPAGVTLVRSPHVRWGFLTGSLADAGGGDAMQHMSLGTFVAGSPVDVARLAGLSGSATYTGHMIGTVLAPDAGGTALRQSIGSFSNTWNFGQRSGTLQAQFDAASYSGTTALAPGSDQFAGTALAGTGTAARVMRLDGAFFHATPLGPGQVPGALGGAFRISNVAGGALYRAEGTFAGTRP